MIITGGLLRIAVSAAPTNGEKRAFTRKRTARIESVVHQTVD
jgi:hypothetical protein